VRPARGKAGAAGKARAADRAAERQIARLQERLADVLAAPVEIRVRRRTQRGEQGEVAIRFDSIDELNGLLDKLGAGEV